MKPLSRYISSTIAAIPVGTASGAAITMFLSSLKWDKHSLWAIGLFVISGIGFIYLAIIHDNIMAKFSHELKIDKSNDHHDKIWRKKAKDVIPPFCYHLLFGLFLLALIGGLFSSYMWKNNYLSKESKQEQIIEKIPVSLGCINHSIDKQQIQLNALQDSLYKWYNNSAKRTIE